MKNRIITLLLLIPCLILASCTPAPTPAPTVTLELPTPSLPVSTATSTPLPPSVNVSETTDCTAGPGAGYNIIASIPAGTELKVVGKDAGEQYWIVLEPATGRGCWVASGLSRQQGDTSALPVLIPGPTVVAVPEAPANLKATFVCTKDVKIKGVRITVTWEDRSDNETGFEVQKNREYLRTLERDAAGFSEFIQASFSGAVLYWVRAENETGKSKIMEIIVSYYCK